MANCLNIKTSEFREMNPALRRWTSPPNPTTIRIVAGQSKDFADGLANIQAQHVSDFQYYKVKRGDTISRIAQRFGTTQKAIVQANNMRNRHQIKIGQKLVIPVPGYVAKSHKVNVLPGNTITHMVKKGDTLFDLAKQYGTTIAQIREHNKIRYGKYIYPGQKLKIVNAEKSSDLQHLVYTVRSGDTLWDISRTYGVSLSRLKRENPHYSSGRLKPGDKLKIYRGVN